MKILLVAAASVAILAGVPATAADECGPLKMVANIKLTPSPGGHHEYVPVEIGGVQKMMILDTGAWATSLSETGAKDLGLERKASPVQTYSLNGTYMQEKVQASFALGVLIFEQFNFPIFPVDLPSDVAGLLGADVLGTVDVSVDFGTNQMDLVLQDHCEGRVKYWKEKPLAVVPFTLSKEGNQIILPIEVDGQRVKAILDTGASGSTLNRPFAENRMGLKMGSADTPEAGDLNGEKGATTWRHTFHTLTFDGVTVSNPEFVIIPERVRKHFQSKELGSLISRPSETLEPDALLGMNVLKHLHVYIAYKEKKLYITPSAAEAPAAAPAK
jgi:predicted aspartyl protease